MIFLMWRVQKHIEIIGHCLWNEKPKILTCIVATVHISLLMSLFNKMQKIEELK